MLCIYGSFVPNCELVSQYIYALRIIYYAWPVLHSMSRGMCW